MIVKRGNKWEVRDSSGEKLLGTHSSEEKAKDQLAAIEISKKKRKTFKEHLEEASSLTLQYHNELNQKLWDKDMLKQEVRDKLLQIGKTWAEFAQIPEEAIVDIILVGGNANFNYTDYSDIDVHILINKEKMPDCPDLLDDYLKDKKQLWAQIHDITVYGHDVELYAQGKDDPTPSGQGVFSLVNNDWIQQPKQEKVDLEDSLIKSKVDYFTQKIDNLISSNAEDESFEKMKDKIKNMRNSSLKKSGENSIENLIFKELRNLGYLDKMNNYIKSREDESLSLK
jgi:hypothetical protein